MARHIIIAGSLALVSFGASALDITVSPGSLQESRPALVNTRDSQLTLTGTADVRDLILLRDLPACVSTVDMSSLTIVPYTYARGSYLGRKTWDAGEIPPYMLVGTGVSVCRLPEVVTTIGEGAFASTRVRSLAIPLSVTKVGDFAYSGCEQLEKVRLASEVQLGKGVFKGCVKLSEVEFGYDIAEIPEAMFDGCRSLAVNPPLSVLKIGAFAYRGSSIVNLELPAVSEIGSYAFADMSALTSVTISTDHNVNVGTGAFFNDGALANIPLGDASIGALALAHTAPSGTLTVNSETIGEAAFANDTRTDTLAFGLAVRNIGKDAFRNMTLLSLIDAGQFTAPVEDVDPTAFSGLENPEGRYDIDLNVKEGTNAAWKAHPVWGLFNVGQFDTAVSDVMAEGVDIAVCRVGGEIRITSTASVDYAGVYSVDGSVLAEVRPGVGNCTVPDADRSQVVVVKVISGGLAKVVKLK